MFSIWLFFHILFNIVDFLSSTEIPEFTLWNMEVIYAYTLFFKSNLSKSGLGLNVHLLICLASENP